jgi:hypothetical protein
MTESIKVNITKAKREQIDALVRAAAKPHAVEAPLDKRHTNKPGKYTAYERFLLSNGHTVYVNLADPSEPKVTVSAKPDKFAQGKVEKAERKKAQRAERKAKREQAAKERKEQKAKKPVKVVKFDPAIPTVPSGEAKDRKLKK